MSSQKNHSWLKLINISFVIMMINIDFAAVNLAAAPIARSFNIGISNVGWIITAFAITAASFMIITGRLADIYGKQKIFILGIIIFILGALVAGLSPNLTVLISGRVIQGIGFAVVFPVSLALAFTALPKKQAGLAIGIIYGIAGIFQAFGPVIAGIIIKTLSWRWIFFVDILFGICALALTFVAYKSKFTTMKIATQKETSKLDYNGAIVLAIVLFLLMLILNKMMLLSKTPVLFGTLIAFLIVCGIGLYYLELKAKNPIIEFKLFLNRNFSIFNIVRFLIGYVYFSFLFVFGLFFQNVLGYNSVDAGLLLMLMTGVMGLLSPFTGKLTDKTGIKLPCVVGLGIFIASYIFLSCLPIPTSWKIFIVPFVSIGLALAVTLPSISVAVLRSVPENKTSYASAVLYTNVFIGGGIGVVITGLLIAKTSFYYLNKSLSSAGLSLLHNKLILLAKVAGGSASINEMHKYFSGETASKLTKIAQSAFMHGFAVSTWVCVALLIFAVVLVLFMSKRANEVK